MTTQRNGIFKIFNSLIIKNIFSVTSVISVVKIDFYEFIKKEETTP